MTVLIVITAIGLIGLLVSKLFLKKEAQRAALLTISFCILLGIGFFGWLGYGTKVIIKRVPHTITDIENIKLYKTPTRVLVEYNGLTYESSEIKDYLYLSDSTLKYVYVDTAYNTYGVDYISLEVR